MQKMTFYMKEMIEAWSEDSIDNPFRILQEMKSDPDLDKEDIDFAFNASLAVYLYKES